MNPISAKHTYIMLYCTFNSCLTHQKELMYHVFRQTNDLAGPFPGVIVVYIVSKKSNISLIWRSLPEDDTIYLDPVEAAQAAISLNKKLNIKLKFEVCDENGTSFLKTKYGNKLLNWANNEYKSFKKCETCCKILENSRENLSSSDDTCSDICRIKRIEELQNQMSDNEETEFYF